MRKLRIVEMNNFIYCIIYFVSLITISNCFLACNPWCIKITLQMFILRHIFLSKRESSSNFFLNDVLHDYVQKNYFRTYLILTP